MIRIQVEHGVIGPSHDPYDTKVVTLTSDTKSVRLYEDGLGMGVFTMKHKGKVIREDSWFDGMGGSKTMVLKADLLAKRFIGKSFSAAEQEWEALPRGPRMAYGYM